MRYVFRDTTPYFVVPLDEALCKAGPYIGPRGGKWADVKHTIPWEEKKPRKPSVAKLPENPWRYFSKEKNAQLLPLKTLISIRAREGGIKRAAEHMRTAYYTGKGKRAPISLMDNGNGTYSVLSGNSTYANAIKSGWKQIPAVVDAKLSAAAKGIQKLIDEKKIRGSVSQHITDTKKSLKGHKKRLDGLLSQLRAISPSSAKVMGRVKTLDSALGKVVRRPDKFKAATELHDLTGMRIITKSVNETYDVVSSIRKRFDITFEDDRIVNPLGGMKYRSFHMIIKDTDGHPKEIQIRTVGMDIAANWTHDVYKPLTAKQEKAFKEHEDNLISFSAQLNDFLFSRDKGDRPPDPRDPGCPPYVRDNFGCPPV